MAISSKHRGWFWDKANSRLYIYVNGTSIGYATTTALSIVPATTVTGLLTASAALTVTTGNLTVTAGDGRITAGNLRLGAVSAFATTEPTSAVVCKSGTAFAGAIATSSGIMSNDTVLRKIIADGTVSNVG
jgi:hypothetical protein